MASPTRATSTRSAAPRTAPARQPPPPPLQVVTPGDVSRSVGALGTALGVFLFLVLLALAGLHAVLVQAQAGLDDLVAENVERRERIAELVAEVAHLDSPEGVAEQARDSGLVAAPEVVTLAPIAPGGLEPPGPNPFGPGSSAG